MKNLLTKLSFLFLLGILTTNIFAAQLVDKIVVIVNNGIITESDIAKEMQTVKQQLASSNTPVPTNQKLRKQVIDNLINQKIVETFCENNFECKSNICLNGKCEEDKPSNLIYWIIGIAIALFIFSLIIYFLLKTKN